jgi:hypothetical protein
VTQRLAEHKHLLSTSRITSWLGRLAKELKGSTLHRRCHVADVLVGSENSEPLIPEILSRSALEGEASSKFR